MSRVSRQNTQGIDVLTTPNEATLLDMCMTPLVRTELPIKWKPPFSIAVWRPEQFLHLGPARGHTSPWSHACPGWHLCCTEHPAATRRAGRLAHGVSRSQVKKVLEPRTARSKAWSLPDSSRGRL